MRTRKRLILPIILIFLLIAAACVGGWLWYDNNVDRSGWVEKDGIRFYQDFHAHPVSGWLDIGEDRYYFHEDGTPYLDWQTIDGVTYYFGTDGIMTTGWLELDGKTHYFGGNGAMVEGWLWLEEGRYYLSDGELLTGWQEIDGNRYYFSTEGIAAQGFTEIDSSTYYFGSDAAMVTGNADIDGAYYYFREDGVMHTGWLEEEEENYYYQEDGKQVFGWLELDGKLYYFDDVGIRASSGWLELGEYTYYFHEDGSAAVGPTVIDGEIHYFSPKGIEVILVNALNPVPDYFQQNFVNVVDYHDVDSRCYDALVQMLSDCNAAGIEYTFNSAYRTLKEQTMILELRTLEHMRDYDMDFAEAREKALDTVAIPGTSEHHLGLAVDLLGDEAIAWFTEHCWDYGFIVRYTEEKESITGIIDEPWHFRYVGTEVSLDMKDSGLCLEEYLGAEPVTDEAVEEYYGDTWYEEVFTTVDEKTIAKYVSGTYSTSVAN